jgi:hypothetical protein
MVMVHGGNRGARRKSNPMRVTLAFHQLPIDIRISGIIFAGGEN